MSSRFTQRNTPAAFLGLGRAQVRLLTGVTWVELIEARATLAQWWVWKQIKLLISLLLYCWIFLVLIMGTPTYPPLEIYRHYSSYIISEPVAKADVDDS